MSQFTADALNRQVITGNILMQVIALGQVSTLAQARQVVRLAFAVPQFEPGDWAGWDQAYARLLAVIQPTG